VYDADYKGAVDTVRKEFVTASRHSISSGAMGSQVQQQDTDDDRDADGPKHRPGSNFSTMSGA